MNLIKNVWTEADINKFSTYLKSFSKGEEKGYWEQRILNTALPCIAVPAPEIKRIAKEILKGNYCSFLDLMPWHNASEVSTCGNIICKIPDFAVMKKYLDIYSRRVDSWSACDILKFKVKDYDQFLALSKEYISSPLVFQRRIGVIILFQFLNTDKYLPEIFDILNSFKNETEYYVNMACAWLLAECFIKLRSETLRFLENNTLNDFIINKGLQKCRDSFRVSAEDKALLLKFKRI